MGKCVSTYVILTNVTGLGTTYDVTSADDGIRFSRGTLQYWIR
jgi:hypothetical protein